MCSARGVYSVSRNHAGSDSSLKPLLAWERARAVLYNVGTGKGSSVREFVDTCREVTGANIKVVMQKEARPGDYAEVYADPAKIQNELNWTARYTDLKEGMATAWKWRQKNPHGYDSPSMPSQL